MATRRSRRNRGIKDDESDVTVERETTSVDGESDLDLSGRRRNNGGINHKSTLVDESHSSSEFEHFNTDTNGHIIEHTVSTAATNGIANGNHHYYESRPPLARIITSTVLQSNVHHALVNEADGTRSIRTLRPNEAQIERGYAIGDEFCICV